MDGGAIVNALRTLSLVGATLTMGLTAGAFVVFAHTIMPGLKSTDDRTFVGAYQSIDRAIINPWFMVGGFVGALVLTSAALALNLHRSVTGWIVVALAFYLIAVVITIAVNVPLNDAITAAGDPDQIDAGRVRAAFDETRWAAWNLVRVVTSLAAFAALAWSLVVHGRATG